MEGGVVSKYNQGQGQYIYTLEGLSVHLFCITAGVPEDICKFPVFLLGPAGLSPNTRAFFLHWKHGQAKCGLRPSLGVPDHFLFLHLLP